MAMCRRVSEGWDGAGSNPAGQLCTGKACTCRVVGRMQRLKTSQMNFDVG